ncbi:hypothetical protein M1843_10735 [Isoptericola sp. 4D.3]|uniref:PASTA domain-containing protein n=1 Tax=Isoptericola peretonis TaxID=2918523 RepID=A0ABT0J3X9_9MICO|nr:hypothetical protein [Isoptericola sp. 4D.3]
MTDPMTYLRATNPVRQSELPPINAGVWSAMQDSIASTPRAPGEAQQQTPRRKRLGKRGALTTGLAVLLIGGGAGYAGIEGWFGGTPQGPNCLADWSDQDAAVIGSWLTGDAIADCDTLMRGAGLAPIEDPVAFTLQDYTYVTPAGQVPGGAHILASGVAVTPQALEMRQSAFDFVDGGNAACRTVPEQVEWARTELKRLGLQGWSVVEADHQDPDAPCSWADAQEPGVVTVGTGADPLDTFAAGTWPLADQLRAKIADRCLTVGEAKDLAEELYMKYSSASADDTLTATAITDDASDCARVDASIGGSVQITVYGPTAKP